MVRRRKRARNPTTSWQVAEEIKLRRLYLQHDELLEEGTRQVTEAKRHQLPMHAAFLWCVIEAHKALRLLRVGARAPQLQKTRRMASAQASSGSDSVAFETQLPARILCFTGAFADRSRAMPATLHAGSADEQRSHRAEPEPVPGQRWGQRSRRGPGTSCSRLFKAFQGFRRRRAASSSIFEAVCMISAYSLFCQQALKQNRTLKQLSLGRTEIAEEGTFGLLEAGGLCCTCNKLTA